MCGVAAIFAHDLDRERAHAALSAMRAAQHHRGPDDHGEHWVGDDRVGLGNCRLSIRDLSPAGHMPMCASDVCITYNGEIYNADELRIALEQRGHRFDSRSDTEVILRGYIEWGDGVVEKLRGMFAFVIFDERSNVLFMARDPLGIKPLYYSLTQPVCVASELRAIVASGLVSKELSDRALSAYLQLGSIPAPLTVYRDVAALRAGHTARIQLDQPRSIELNRYWDLSTRSAQSTEADVKTALEDAVASHLVADVPVGAFLSGGLDSSTVVTIAASLTGQPLRTCSIAFESADRDESRYARAVADALGTQHHERLVTRDDFLREVGNFATSLDQPSIDGFNTYFVSQTAQQAGLKVALSGLGGDELFGGYPSFNGVPRMLRALRTARPVAGAITRLGRSDRWRKVSEAATRAVTPSSAFLVYRGLYARQDSERLLPVGLSFDTIDSVNDRAGAFTGSLREWVARAELGTYTTAQLLRDSDVMSMAHSVELRVPLLDTRLVETVSGLPSDVRFKGKGSKPLLRRLMSNRLPSIVTNKRPRQGFTFPLQQWLAHESAAPLWEWNAEVFEHFDRAELRGVQDRFNAGRTHWSRVWALMALNEWSRRSAHA